MNRRLLVLLTVGVVALVTAVAAGILRSHQREPAQDSPALAASFAEPITVPWRDLPVAEYPEVTWPPRPVATPCRAADFHDAGWDTESEGTDGTELIVMLFRYKGAGRCTLSGRPTLLGRDSRGTKVTIPVTASTRRSPAPDQVPATIDPGEIAQIGVETYRSCLDGRAQITYRALRFRLPDGSGELRAGKLINATCGVGLTVWHRSTALSVLIDRFAALTATIEAPARVHPGSTLDFVVTLHNVTPRDIPLYPCPNYRVVLEYPDPGEEEEAKRFTAAHQLNCAVPMVPAGGQVRFAMRLDLPDSNELLGDPTLYWVMDSNGIDGVPTAGAPIAIRL